MSAHDGGDGRRHASGHGTAEGGGTAHGPGRRHEGGHSHAHGSTEDVDWNVMGDFMERSAELRLPFHEEAAVWLRGLLGGVPVLDALDVGSGPGVFSAVLARAFPGARILAVDGSAALLERARRRASSQGLTGQIRTLAVELPGGLDSLEPVDLIWTGQVVHHLGDQQDALRRLAALLRPNGLLAVVEGGLPARFLPRDIGFGRPGLQSRLDVAAEEWFARMRASLPGATSVVEHWPGLLADAGLEPAGSRTFLIDRPAPLPREVREHLRAEMALTRERMEGLFAKDDLATVDRLLDPDDEGGLMRRPDVFQLFARTVHTARALPSGGDSPQV